MREPLHILRFQFEALYCLTTSSALWITSLWHVNTWLVQTHKCPLNQLMHPYTSWCLMMDIVWYDSLVFQLPVADSPPQKNSQKAPFAAFFYPLGSNAKDSEPDSNNADVSNKNLSRNTRATSGSQEKNNSWLMLTPSKPGLPAWYWCPIFCVSDLGGCWCWNFPFAYWKSVVFI